MTKPVLLVSLASPSAGVETLRSLVLLLDSTVTKPLLLLGEFACENRFCILRALANFYFSRDVARGAGLVME